ncbi:hypothetical protein [Kitasatospora sp. GAS1066B]|uniref:hypothetical protein n=1 Tax=Kitasatospora sp. GAS1066B TaxID=3156271 RepID=UPI0035168AD5
MTATGDHHSIPTDSADAEAPEESEESGESGESDGIPGPGRPGSRFGARRVLVGSVAVVVLGAGGWLVSRPHPGDWLPGLGPTSQGTKYPSVVGTPPPTSSDNPSAFDVKRLFPPTKLIDLDTYKGWYAGARQGGDCAETLQNTGQALLHGAVCQGYLALDFTRQDGKVETSVTVLRFGADGIAGAVANSMRGQHDLVRFVQTDGSLAGAGAPSSTATSSTAASPSSSPSTSPGAAGAKAEPPPRVEAVRHYVTVTSSRFADGHSPTTPQDLQDLDAATRAASYTVGIAFVWS